VDYEQEKPVILYAKLANTDLNKLWQAFVNGRIGN